MNFLSTIKSTINNYIGDEVDGDTEDDTHICRVLRQYYAEKSRPLPPWLPPDPKAPVVTPQYVNPSASRSGAYGGYGGFGGQPAQQSQGRVASGGSGRGVLSDLWDSPQRQAVPVQEENMSMRRGAIRPSALSRQPGGGVHNRNQSGSQDSGYSEDAARRPLPSQRAGSFQTHKASSIRDEDYRSNQPSPSSLSNWSAQDRLKAKLAGGRSGSPVSSVQSTNSSHDSRSKYDDYGGAGAGGGGWGSSRGQAQQQSGRSYDSGQSRYDGGGGGNASGNPYEQQKPYVSATAPWSSGDDLYGGGSNGQSNNWGSGTAGSGRWGLPNGPKGRR